METPDRLLPPDPPRRPTPSGVPLVPAPADGHPSVPEVDDERRTAHTRRAEDRREIDRRVTAVVEGMSDAFLAIAPDWRVTYANREAARLNGVRPEALVGRDHWTTWPETVGSEVERQYRRVVAEGIAVQFEHHYPGADVWHDIRAYPADDGGLAVFYRDVTPQKRAAAALAEAHERALAVETRFQLLVDRVRGYGIFFLDANGIITHWGLAAQRMNGHVADEAIGRPLTMLYPDAGTSDDGAATAHLRHAIEHGEYIGEGTRLRRDGTTFPARVVLTALRRGGQLVGFSSITQDLTEEREREAALARAIADAQTANGAKSQFLANTSHEIRTPLNAVMGYAELLAMGMAGPLDTQQAHYVSRIQAASRHLLGLVNDVLDMAKIEAGQMRAAREPALVVDAVSTAIGLVEPQARARDVELVNECTEAPHAYRGDGERVRQILANLLANAVRFTEAGGRVAVSCGAAPSPDFAVSPAARDVSTWTYVRVADTGVGIEPDQLERIWGAFVQVDPSRTRRFGGSGLGLTISRHLARLMGGDITAESAVGRGSAFTLWLPAASPDDVRAAVRLADAADRTPTPTATMPAAAATASLAAAGPEEAVGLGEVSDALLAEAERVLATFVARLRHDAATPVAAHLGDPIIEDHGTTLIAEIAQTLGIVAQDGAVAGEMLRDGRAIRQLVARRHGAQRARLGWTETALRREYEILREELHAAIARRLTRAGATEMTRATSVIDYVLDSAMGESVAAFVEATTLRGPGA